MPESIIETDIAEEMRDSYMEYAMSVIIGRALPDVRDGLKPVHRRVLYSMYEQGNDYNKPYRKSARVVGDVIGKYHPHGDSAVYDTIVRLTQDFSLRYPLIDGQGNFGSVDGDAPAAMRYTEIRMKRLAHELLADLDKETVAFVPNYDDSLEEPSVLPTKIPNLLVNGSTGIAVGMANNIPPHNLTEVINGLLYYIDHRDQPALAELMRHISGPDFPTGGTIIGRKGIYEAYATGRGSITVRAKTHVEQDSNGRESIIVTELPYMVNKANLIEKIADLVREKRLEGISDLRDESDRTGMRIYIQVKKSENPEVVLSNLFKHTALQSSYGIIMLAIVDQQPKILPLIHVLRLFLEHRIQVVTRRLKYELKQAQAKAHILDGLNRALDQLDAVIEDIRRAENGGDAQALLMSRYQLSQIQAHAILEMKLQRLTGLEQHKIRDDYQDLLKAIANYQTILNSEEKILEIIRQESLEIQQKYGDGRRTEIIEGDSSISIEELINREDMVVTISHAGYIKRSSVSEYRLQNRGGKGKLGMATKDEDFVEKMFVASTHDYLLVFTNFGQVFSSKVYELPLAGPNSRGKAVVNLFPLRPEEKVCAYLSVPEFAPDRSIVMVTAKGICKKTDLLAFARIRSSGIRAITVHEGDALISAQLVEPNQELFLVTRLGWSLRFPESQIREMGRTARGVRGIRLREGDQVAAMEVLRTQTGTILTVTENGYGKKSPLEAYPLRKKRGSKGVRVIKVSERNGLVVGAMQVEENFQVFLVTQFGKIIRIRVNQIPTIGRVSQGVKLFGLNNEERVIDMALVVDSEESESINAVEATISEEAVREAELEAASAPEVELEEEDEGELDAEGEDEETEENEQP